MQKNTNDTRNLSWNQLQPLAQFYVVLYSSAVICSLKQVYDSLTVLQMLLSRAAFFKSNFINYENINQSNDVNKLQHYSYSELDNLP